MDKLTAIKIKYNDGTYSDEIPVSVLAENVRGSNNNNLNLTEILGNVKVSTAGTVQNQIDALVNEKADVSDVTSLGTRMTNVETEISGIAGGTPPMAASTNEMDPDESTVYINTTDGNWYYWNGSAWQIGGVYGGAVTSTTFDKHGVPADDFAVGEALADKADASDVDALDDRVTALESDSSGGLTADIKSALLACFANVAWEGTDGQDYIDALDAALNPPAGVVSISAVYTQSGTVYETSSLDSLKPDLVVTARYDNATTQVITNYTLSGTLTEGTSTITVSFGGKTTTFNVNVSEALPMLYPLTNGVHTLDDGSVLTITDNNHIKLEASANPSQFVNLYTCEAGTADVVNNKPVWFTLPASASTILTVKDITKTIGVNTQFNLRKALSTVSSGYSLTFNSYITDPTDKTYTPGSDENISCPFLYQPKANQTFEFTLELVVNGGRYI